MMDITKTVNDHHHNKSFNGYYGYYRFMYYILVKVSTVLYEISVLLCFFWVNFSHATCDLMSCEYIQNIKKSISHLWEIFLRYVLMKAV